MRLCYATDGSVSVSMLPPNQTPRQYLMDLLAGIPRSSYELAALLGMPEREVEDHLRHIERSLARDRTRRFVLEPSMCQGCHYVFRERTRLTRPSRCPRCRHEAISAPRFMIHIRRFS
jgi:predicted Zn-ribbon and HTH transcriptional regulator